ncbi:MAG: FAD-binding oxidoreductase, partial [Actinobacteria bacterium]|nr:FAD-binding oxidoreductase [Actinomycetota bacterium]
MTDAPIPGAGVPTPPIALAGERITPRTAAARVSLDESQLATLRTLCAEIVTDAATLADAGRDWWPLAMTWAENGQVGGIASVLCRPSGEAEIAAIARFCNAENIPLTVSGGRSGVVGGSVPVHGGVQVDLTRLNGIVAVDETSLLARVQAGTFGDHFEHELRTAYGLTAGHWPQSMALATVGGWAACRGAGQLSTRYGKIEDIVCGLRVVLADGSIISTGGQPREAAGPDLTQLFIGSEGTFGIITELTVRLHPAPPATWRAAFGFDSFSAGLDACRRILRRGATPAVLRLYDA